MGHLHSALVVILLYRRVQDIGSDITMQDCRLAIFHIFSHEPNLKKTNFTPKSALFLAIPNVRQSSVSEKNPKKCNQKHQNTLKIH